MFFVILTRVGIALCTAILLINTADVLKLRHNTAPAPDVIRELQSGVPVKISLDVITQDYYRITSSRWLGVHVWPVLPWLILAYLQTSSILRKRALRWHRRFGRALLLTSLAMTFGHMMMFIARETILGDADFYLDFAHPEKFFTFRAACLVFTAWWIVCMYKLYKTATRKTAQAHRYWAYQFLATGFGVGTSRIYLVLCYALGYPLSGPHYITKHAQDLIMGYSLWVGFTLNCVVTHFCTRFTQSAPPPRQSELKSKKEL